MKVVLVSTYDLGRQPFGLASPAAWLRAAGHEVTCVDLATGILARRAVLAAGMIAFHLPMHTATRLAAPVIRKVRELNPGARIVCYGLYAPLNAEYLRGLGVEAIAGGEFEPELVRLASGAPPSDALVQLERLTFVAPDRTGLPGLDSYAKVRDARGARQAGYTETTRGCKHFCRHCPVVPVYRGAFRVVQSDVVLEDIRRQIAAGAEHITFGDPDFFNGPAHGLRIVRAMHQEFPQVTYDVTIKVEHLLRHKNLLPELQETGCAFVTSAVESIDDRVLQLLDKGHTRADFVAVVEAFRGLGLALSPTFIPFTPWTTREGYAELLALLAELALIDAVSPVQLALRLLITAQSRLLELPEVKAVISGFDQAALLYRWSHADAAMDELAVRALRMVAEEQKRGRSRREIFGSLWQLANGAPMPENYDLIPRAAIPYLDEPWYC